MNEWLIQYIFQGNHSVIVFADTLELAIRKFCKENPEVPSLALYSIECIR